MIYSSPAASSYDEMLSWGEQVDSGSANIHATSLRNGTNLWTYNVNLGTYGSGALADGILYYPSDDGWLYAFGNGHNYRYKAQLMARHGTNTLTIYANNSAGIADSATITFNVSGGIANSPPVANIAGPLSAIAGDAIMLDASGSHDPDNDTMTCAWDFGDSATGTGKFPVHAYTNAGNYTITLNVTDTNGASDTAQTAINVTNRTYAQPSGIALKANVTNSLPAAGIITIAPDDSLMPGVQINKSTNGTKKAFTSTNITDLNGNNDIIGVTATITGPSSIYDSPVRLLPLTAFNTTTSLYNATFGMKPDYASGNYTIQVNATDKKQASTTSMGVFYYSG
jgi:PKD repeat protein